MLTNNAEAIVLTNTSLAGDAPWDVTRHTHLRSVAVTRLALCVAYVLVNCLRSISHPNEVWSTLLSQCHYAMPLTFVAAAAAAVAAFATAQARSDSNHPLPFVQLSSVRF